MDQHLLDTALVDEDAGIDMHGNPRRLWNAVNGETFVGVSANLAEPTYNCYPAAPASAAVRNALVPRARVGLDEFLARDSETEEEA